MSAFFKTEEYKFLVKLRSRLQVLNTANNYKLYKNHVDTCRALAKKSFQSIGWRESDNDYAWAKFDESQFRPQMKCLGGFDEMSFYPGQILYTSDENKSWALKDVKGTIYFYTEAEVKMVSHLGIKDLQRIHDVKMTFDGRILNDDEFREQKGNKPSKKMAKFVR